MDVKSNVMPGFVSKIKCRTTSSYFGAAHGGRRRLSSRDHLAFYRLEGPPREESGSASDPDQEPIRPERWAAWRLLGGLLAFYTLCLIAYRGDFSTQRAKLINYGLIALVSAFGLLCGFLNYLV